MTIFSQKKILFRFMEGKGSGIGDWGLGIRNWTCGTERLP